MLLYFFWNLIAFIITIGILVIIHEFGHFLAALFFKVKVERFSIGFGPVLWSWKSVNGIEYTLSIIPLGGYVKIFDTLSIEEMNDHQKNYNTFRSRNIWKRIVIVLMGPIFNILFSILLYTFIYYVIGIPFYKPVINYILPDSFIEQSHIPVGSKIISINNVPVIDWESVRFQILNNINKKKLVFCVALIHENHLCLETYDIFLTKNWLDISIFNNYDPILVLGMLPNVISITSIPSEIGLYCVDKKNELNLNDKILLVNKQPIYSWNSFIPIITKNNNQIFQITIERDKQLLNLNVILFMNNLDVIKNSYKNANYFLKFNNCLKTQYPETSRYTLYFSILKACNKVIDLIILIINLLFQLIFGNIKIVNLHGPIAIAQEARKSICLGLSDYLMLLAVISINLSIINLLPFPMLDGGQLCFLLIEKIKGTLLSRKIENFSYIISIILLIILIILVTYNDITKIRIC